MNGMKVESYIVNSSFMTCNFDEDDDEEDGDADDNDDDDDNADDRNIAYSILWPAPFMECTALEGRPTIL